MKSLLLPLLLCASCAYGADQTWIIDSPINDGVSSFTQLRLVGDLDGKPYFPIVGALIDYKGSTRVENEPIFGSCTNTDNTYYTCVFQSSSMKLRAIFRPGGIAMVFVTESRMGEQGPYGLVKRGILP